MKYLLSILTFVICLQTGFAQYTELINSRRPGFSDSPFGVGTNVLQFESGLFYRKIKDQDAIVNSTGTDLMVRYGKFWEKLEVNLNTAFQYDNINFTDTNIEDISGFALSKLTVGAKYLVFSPKYTDKSKEIMSWKKRNGYDWKRLYPAVAVYAGVNVPITKNFTSGNYPNYTKDKLSPRLAIYTQNNFTDKFVFVMNLIMDKLGSGKRENSYIFTGTYSFTERWSVFAEHQGIFKDEDIPNDYQFGGGVAYLFNKNTQFDIATRTISDRGGSTLLINAGFAWRWDKHQDAFKLIGSDGKVTEGKKEGNFFSRLFGKKNKAKKQRKVKKIKAKKRKIKKDKPRKKSKAQKRREKEASKKAKEEAKKRKKELKNYKKNYDPKKDKENDS